MDMCKSYISAVREELPGIGIVYDRFHVMKLINAAVDKVRKNTCAWLGSQKQKERRTALKRSRFLFLKGSDLLKDSEKKRLDNALAAYEPLMVAYLMKERIRLFWNLANKKKAQKFLLDWCFEVFALNWIVSERGKHEEGSFQPDALRPLVNLAMTLLKHLEGLLNYLDHPISNGRAEGVNNKIKTLKRQAYGYRDTEYFKLRLYHLHVQKHQLAG